MEEARHDGLVGVGIGKGIDEEHFAALDELVVMAVAILSDIIFIHGTRDEEGGVLLW